MGSSKWWGAVLISSVSFSSAAGLAQDPAQEVLVNRSFENGPDPGQMKVVNPGNTSIEGWTVVGGNVSYVAGKWKPSQGLRSVGLLCGGGISQTFKTDPNQKYEVRFFMAGDPNARPAVKSVDVSFGENTHSFTFDTTGRSPGEMGWDARSWIFAAAGGTTTLTFRSPATQCSTPAVDNVRVMSVESAVQARPIDAPLSRSASGSPFSQ